MFEIIPFHIVHSSESYFLNIIQWTLIARPASTVLLRLVDLLTAVSGCEAIMKGLCTKCGKSIAYVFPLIYMGGQSQLPHTD